MLRLWKNFCKDFRQLYVGSSANVEATNINCCSIPSLSDNEGRNSCISPNQETLNVATSTKDEHSSLGCEQKSEDSNNYRRPYFKWNLTKSIFLEICGLSSAVALGWEYGQFRQKKSSLSCVDYSAILVRLLTIRVLPSINAGVRLPINDVPPKSNVSYTDVLAKKTTIEASDKYINTNTSHVPSLSEEIHETMERMLTNLETSNNLGLAEWQNSVGVELINSAKKKELSEYDHLIKISKIDRFSAYQREAFNCFLESRRLGSAKGAYNLGICCEQGIGTSQNVEKAFTYYEEAARKNHPAAQYNLGLLLYRRYLNNEKSKESDLSDAFSNLRQAANHGLEEARSALTILTIELATQDVENVTTILPAQADEKNLHCEFSKHELSIRKAFSEPHSFNCCNVNDKSEIINFEFKKGSVNFYFGD